MTFCYGWFAVILQFFIPHARLPHIYVYSYTLRLRSPHYLVGWLRFPQLLDILFTSLVCTFPRLPVPVRVSVPVGWLWGLRAALVYSCTTAPFHLARSFPVTHTIAVTTVGCGLPGYIWVVYSVPLLLRLYGWLSVTHIYARVTYFPVVARSGYAVTRRVITVLFKLPFTVGFLPGFSCHLTFPRLPGCPRFSLRFTHLRLNFIHAAYDLLPRFRFAFVGLWLV